MKGTAASPLPVGHDAYADLVSRMTTESRAAQGLPPRVQDAAAVARIRALLQPERPAARPPGKRDAA